jgi:hypothetical protein
MLNECDCLNDSEALGKHLFCKIIAAIHRQASDGKKRKVVKSKVGTKMCMPCNKVHPIEDFPPGKACCGGAFNAQRNIKAAAIAQGQEEWWNEVSADPHKLSTVVQAYMRRISPEVTGAKRNKRNAFCVATYKDE